MSVEKHRQMTADRLKKWIEENPLKYAEARRKNLEAIKSSESQGKRIASLKKWSEKNLDKHAIWQEKLLRARTSKDANEKHKVSLKGWRDNNLDQANANAHKRAKAAAAKRSKQVCMMDLNSGEVLRNFISLHEFAKWLV